jgi:hypothetical protein
MNVRSLAVSLGCVIVMSVGVTPHAVGVADDATKTTAAATSPHDNGTHAPPTTPSLPTLNWPKPTPADWLDVAAGCGGGMGAVGNGVVDDTEAIQVRAAAARVLHSAIAHCPLSSSRAHNYDSV